jgi:acetylornithine/N-succinyldiaminopimelate aminotransferase
MSAETAGKGAQAAAPAAPYDDSALLGVYRPASPVFIAGRGSRLIAEDGREFLDFASGIAVNALGYGDEGIAEAFAVGVASGLVHVSNLFRTRPAAELAAELVKLSFADRVFFCNSGAEANEGAFKFARKWARQQGGPGKHEIVALSNGFHGRLFGSLAATDRPAYQQPFEPLMPGVRIIPVGDEAAAREAISPERTAAIIAEPVQGEGGVVPLPTAFARLLRSLADESNALLIFDEVQCGLGRTGRLWAHEALGVTPDLLTVAKPLAGGLPMGAVLMTERVASVMKPGDHATTFGGGPLVARIALEVVRWKSERLRHLLEDLRSRQSVKTIRGIGLMWGIELHTEAAPVIAGALERGLIVISAGPNVVRLVPPLSIEPAELDRGFSILQGVLS